MATQMVSSQSSYIVHWGLGEEQRLVLGNFQCCHGVLLIFITVHVYIENSRIELRGIVLQVPSNQIKVTFIIILPFNLVHL